MTTTNSLNIPEYVYMHSVVHNKETISSASSFDDGLIIISIKPLNDDAIKVKLTTIKKKCYINGYGIYEP